MPRQAATGQSTLFDFSGPEPEAGPVPKDAPPRPLDRTGEPWEEGAVAFGEVVRAEGLVGLEWARRISWHVARTPGLLRRVGFDPPPAPDELRAHHLHGLRERLGWSRNGLAVYFAALRKFLRFRGYALAEERGAWRLPSGEATRRRWITPDQLVLLGQVARGEEKVLVVLEGYNGLRRIEVKRMRVRDLDFAQRRIRVCGKGRSGGKWRTIPMTLATAEQLRPWVEGRAEDTLVLPRSASGLDLLLSRAVRRAGLGVRVSNHDLRRTFGRQAYQSGMSLVDLKNFLGHVSVDMTTRYIGIDEDRMREGLSKFDERMAGFALTVAAVPPPQDPRTTKRAGRRTAGSPIDRGRRRGSAEVAPSPPHGSRRTSPGASCRTREGTGPGLPGP